MWSSVNTILSAGGRFCPVDTIWFQLAFLDVPIRERAYPRVELQAGGKKKSVEVGRPLEKIKVQWYLL